MAGRKSKFTPEVKERLVAALKAGNTRRAACAYAGISTDSLARYLKNADFAAAIMRAEAECEVGFIAVIKKCALEGDWKAAAWWASHHPAAKTDWKETRELELKSLTVDQLLALAQECERGVESAGDRAALEEAASD